jgi:NADH:ubiquinone oxidoreductase subunit
MLISSKIFTKMYLKLFAKYIGEDDYGNSYYEHKRHANSNGKKLRYCMYFGIPEGSKVPPYWHMWLHYNEDSVPKIAKMYHWQKDHLPNTTGTRHADFPLFHSINLIKNKVVAKMKYKAWKPD